MLSRITSPDEVLSDLRQAYLSGSRWFDAMIALAKEEGYSNPEIREHVYRGNWAAFDEYRKAHGIPEDTRGPRPVYHGFTSTYARGCRCNKCWDARERYLQKRKGWA